eukprot:7447468-Lingulodinium_polyedra.AAC.1
MHAYVATCGRQSSLPQKVVFSARGQTHGLLQERDHHAPTFGHPNIEVVSTIPSMGVYLER